MQVMARFGVIWLTTMAFWALVAWWVGSWTLLAGAAVFFTVGYAAVYGIGAALERRQSHRR